MTRGTSKTWKRLLWILCYGKQAVPQCFEIVLVLISIYCSGVCWRARFWLSGMYPLCGATVAQVYVLVTIIYWPCYVCLSSVPLELRDEMSLSSHSRPCHLRNHGFSRWRQGAIWVHAFWAARIPASLSWAAEEVYDHYVEWHKIVLPSWFPSSVFCTWGLELRTKAQLILCWNTLEIILDHEIFSSNLTEPHQTFGCFSLSAPPVRYPSLLMFWINIPGSTPHILLVLR
jgi:hypothetical protein